MPFMVASTGSVFPFPVAIRLVVLIVMYDAGAKALADAIVKARMAAVIFMVVGYY